MSIIKEQIAKFPQLDGVFVLNKPSGHASAKCLSIFKRLGQKKVGHGGTLDPLASGVLLVLLGQATKLSSHLLSGGRKIYSGTFKLGEETDTWDSQGKIIDQKSWQGVSADQVEKGMESLKGSQVQEVPPFSAAKYNGVPLYKLARKSQPVPVKTKIVEIFDAAILDIRMPYVDFRISCSSGSYIRSLAHSLGKRLECGAHLCNLVREYSHPYSLENATSLSDLEQTPDLLVQRLMTIQSALPEWDNIYLGREDAQAVRNGHAIPANSFGEGKTRGLLLEGETPLALAEKVCKGDKKFWIVKRGLWK